MTTITTTRPAKCKDCRYCQRYTDSITNSKGFRCENTKSPRYDRESSKIHPEDFVCEVWKL